MRAPLAAVLLATLALPAATAPSIAQMPATAPGKPDAKLVTAGSYKVDPNHTQVLWTVDHMGISPLSGLFPTSTGTLDIDPVNLAATKLSVTFNIAELVTSAPGLTKHLQTPDFFDVAKFPTATFVSTGVVGSGNTAKVTGNLTIKGVTKPVTLDVRFFGAGPSPMSKKLNIGFHASTTIKRSDFNLGYGVPVVGDEVKLGIHAAFEKLN
jgi:polyisoprenoid-binding protein YceI